MAFTTKPDWPLQEAVDKAVEHLTNDAALYGQSVVKVTFEDDNVDFKNIPLEEVYIRPEETIKFTYECEGFWPRQVTATKIGDLALEFTADDWEIYYLPTRSRFNIMDGYYTKDPLISWCEAVQKQLLPEWEVLRNLTPERFKDKDCTWQEQQAKDRIQQLCLNTPCE